MKLTNKKYWYHFTFISHVASATSYSSGSMGFVKNHVTKKSIEWAREQLGAHESAIMINCSFLGRMTFEEFSS